MEQAAFSPGNLVPGITPSPDKMLQGRLFGYNDAHRYRLGANYQQLPVNAPKGEEHGRSMVEEETVAIFFWDGPPEPKVVE